MKEILFYCDNPTDYYQHRSDISNSDIETNLRANVDECFKLIWEGNISVLVIDIEQKIDLPDVINNFSNLIDNIIVVVDEADDVELLGLINFNKIELLNSHFVSNDLMKVIESFDIQEYDDEGI